MAEQIGNGAETDFLDLLGQKGVAVRVKLGALYAFAKGHDPSKAVLDTLCYGKDQHVRTFPDVGAVYKGVALGSEALIAEAWENLASFGSEKTR